MQFWKYYQVIKTRFALFVLISLLATVAAGLFLKMRKGAFTGVSRVFIAPPMGVLTSATMAQRDNERILQTLFKLANSQPVLQATIQKLKLDARVQELEQIVSVEHEHPSFILRISAKDREERKAGLMAKTVAEEFARYVNNLNTQEAREAKVLLQKRLDEVQERMLAARKAISSVPPNVNAGGNSRRAAGSGSASGTRTDAPAPDLGLSRLAALKMERDTAFLSLQQTEARLGLTRQKLARTPQGVSQQTTEVESHDHQALSKELEDVKAQIRANLASGRTETHPTVRALQAQQEQLEGMLEQAARRSGVLPLTQIPNPAYEEALQEVQVLAGLVTEYRTQLANLDKMISEEQTTLRKAAEVESRRARLRVDLTVREQDYTSTYNELRRIRTLEMASRQLGSVTIMGPPVIYPGQSLSNSRIALLALFAGIGIGLAAIFGLDYVDNRVKTPYDMEQLFGLPIMGITPSFDNALHANGGSPLLHRVIPSWQDPSAENGLASAGEDYSYSPDSAHTEALRVVRTKILSSSPSLRSVMVTSTRSAQGKSTVAANLAILTAQISKNVILIDADLRRPTIHLHLGMANDTGLSEVLAGTACVDDVVRKTSVGNLRFLPAGIPPQNPADLISSDAMRELIEELSDQADLVIVDTPPVADFADSLVMARYVDGVMLAYRAGQMPLDVDIRAKAQLEGMQANLLGVVLTDVQRGVSGIGYSYDYYRYSYRPPQ